jgi:hypothetical protein
MSFTARHYNSIQRIIREERTRWADPQGDTEAQHGATVALCRVQEDIGRMLAADNPRFDLTRYNMECEPK